MFAGIRIKSITYSNHFVNGTIRNENKFTLVAMNNYIKLQNAANRKKNVFIIKRKQV